MIKSRALWPAMLASFLLSGCGIDAAAQSAQANDSNQQRKSIELTIYKNDFAQVGEERDVQLTQGESRLRIGSVSSMMDQDSVIFDWREAKAAVVSSTYDLGVAGASGLLRQHLGREVDLVTYGQDGHEAERTRAVLEVAEPGNLILRAGDRVLINPPGSIEVPKDEAIVMRPQLSAEVQSEQAFHGPLQITYLTRGMSWSAEYVGSLDPQKDTMRLECWASVRNETGVNYPDAKITLMAGEPNRAAVAARHKSEVFERPGLGAGGRADASVRPFEYAANAAPEASGELYAYPVEATATISHNQISRVRMIGADAVQIKKDYSLRLPHIGPWDHSYYGWGSIEKPQRVSAQLAIAFKNSKESGLGLPLPQGAVRIYEASNEKGRRYIGAASIPDSPANANNSLTVSKVFDVYVEPRVAKVEKVSDKVVRKTVELTLTNEKERDVELRLVQPVAGRWKIVTETSAGGNLTSDSRQWKVKVPAKGKQIFSYTLEFSN